MWPAQNTRSPRCKLASAVIDATAPWGYGYVFPRGLLRESPRNLRRADLILLTRCDQVDEESLGRLRARVSKRAPGIPLVETSHRPEAWVNTGKDTRPLDDLRQRPVAAFCGIGNPDACPDGEANEAPQTRSRHDQRPARSPRSCPSPALRPSKPAISFTELPSAIILITSRSRGVSVELRAWPWEPVERERKSSTSFSRTCGLRYLRP